mmetsp:Transcript_20119/g.47213  ORF Transcript_20119/g.47213 Transcript_20119/m.47213 type:complete len:253 (-) Transcript_20119:588-1346(-)
MKFPEISHTVLSVVVSDRTKFSFSVMTWMLSSSGPIRVTIVAILQRSSCLRSVSFPSSSRTAGSVSAAPSGRFASTAAGCSAASPAAPSRSMTIPESPPSIASSVVPVSFFTATSGSAAASCGDGSSVLTTAASFFAVPSSPSSVPSPAGASFLASSSSSPPPPSFLTAASSSSSSLGSSFALVSSAAATAAAAALAFPASCFFRCSSRTDSSRIRTVSRSPRASFSSSWASSSWHSARTSSSTFSALTSTT